MRDRIYRSMLRVWIMFFPFVARRRSDTYLTEREKSPGALSLSLIRKAPSFLCLLSISSALARGIFPKNHLPMVENKFRWALNTSASRSSCRRRRDWETCDYAFQRPRTRLRLNVGKHPLIVCWKKNAFFIISMQLIRWCWKIKIRTRNVSDTDGWGGRGRQMGGQKPAKSSLLV